MKRILQVITLSLLALFLVACGNKNGEEDKQSAEKVKVAVVGSKEKELWEYVAEKAKKENIDLEVVELNDYNQPNQALVNGSVDMNAFQHYAFLKQWNEESGENVVPIGLTFITPLYIFSDKIDSLDDLPENGQVIVPIETAIQGRALLALQTAGVIKLKDGGSTQSSLADITENPKNIEFVEVESAQAPRMIQDVDAAVLNGGFAEDAGLAIEDNIFTDADYLDTIPADRYNLIAVREEDKDNETYRKIVDLYNSDDVAEKMDEISPGQYYPVWERADEVDFLE
ncbi:MetQ/NlpA family ABC transporter substrate-binding protein [Aerococcus kribbianus]|uniref:Lipoprotein n=1 Tax=Aerococcus kribbianus TaxID=2999064 RepID=A0A9X3FQ97_9LACT|nr:MULTISPECIES: MetQ/NlpA family ABC transporter substrate-binding protein [unclassified Aerococcus]MCZ0717586.1 MetQ/NlpA family ABC transporter substrate-binding protein [Aerococcus sp. YH-aer221]MCZ0725874.1 MetQ/NlpA family ABC transporter substrate-binding protein [Aerococcus sp. YH-aer222]